LHRFISEIKKSYLKIESQGDLCPLCGMQRRQFEPTVLYCQGKCGMQRIKPDAIYYTDRTKQNHWCEPCYSLTKATEHFDLDDGTKVFKKGLQEFKNDSVAEEGWVHCDDCNSWVHQICGLFNGRTNNSSAKYTCPRCTLKNAPDLIGRHTPPSFMKGAKELPHCKMSLAIENGLFQALEVAYMNHSKVAKVPFDDIKKVEGLAVRVLSSVDKNHVVGEKVC
jgi:E1A/CREB-binding protein